MKRLIKFTLFRVALLASIAFVGCTEDLALDSPTIGGADGGEGVVFNFVVDDLNVATEDQGSSPSTKTDDNTPSTTIKNMWVVQYDGSNDFLSKEYYEDFSTTGCVTLAAGVSDIIFIANTFDDDLIADNITLAELKALTTTDVLGIDGTDEYFMMNGTIDDYDSQQDAPVTLKRNVAKVNIVVTNGLDATYTLTDITVHNIPDNSPIYTNYTGAAATSTTTSYKTSVLESSGATIYLPVNEQGTVDSNTDSKDKVENAPTNATYVVVTFNNGFSNRTYTFYLGADMEDDYNISANNAYNYTFNISAVGDENDPRVGSEIAYVKMVNAADIATWKSNNSDNTGALVTDYFDFEYTVGEVKGRNYRSTSEVIAEAAMDVNGKATVAVSSHGISIGTDVSTDVLPQLQAVCGTGVELPTQEELMYMWILKGNNSFPSNDYWSSTVASNASNERWYVSFGNGGTYTESASYSSNYARAVKGISLQ